jgi:hypothetical protein
VTHRFDVPPREVVFVKSIVEASEGIASIFATSGGNLTLAAPRERVGALRELLVDLAAETGGTWAADDEGDDSERAAPSSEPGVDEEAARVDG